MSMMDLYTLEQAKEALEDAEETKKEFFKQIEELNIMIFILKYYIATGDGLEPSAFDLEGLEGDEDD